MNKQLITGIAVAAGIAVVGLFFVYDVSGGIFNVTAPAAALVVQDETIGAGAEAIQGSLVNVQYTGRLENGTVFDTSVGKAPIEFLLGQGYVIQGWERGILGMKVGGKRLLIIPPDMAYGAQANGPIPANSTLIFEVELVGIKN
jgi:peptidylprolyl isomerase/FKBP-type peptidyl-prolyl cis-trans isomerase FkpA